MGTGKKKKVAEEREIGGIFYLREGGAGRDSPEKFT